MASVPRDRPEGAVLAFDFGLRRIGVAIADMSFGVPHPLDSIAFEDNRRRFEAIAALVGQWQPTRLVVGCPRAHDDATDPGAIGVPADHPMIAPIRRFARRLQARFGLPVDLVDEHLSSWEASRRLTQAGLPARAQRGRVDSMAACTILETWLVRQQSRSTGGGHGQ